MRAVTSLRSLAVLAAGALMLQIAALGGPLPSAHAEDKDDKVKQKQEVDQRIDELRGELTDVNADLSETYLALARTELEIPNAQQRLTDAQTELATARDEDERTGERLRTAQEEEQTLSGQVEQGRADVTESDEKMDQAALAAYKGGGLPNPASVYVGAEHPQDAVDRSMNYRLTLEAQGTRLDALRTDQAVTENAADRLAAVRTEIADLKVKAEQAVQAKQQAETEAATAKQSLDDLYAQQTTQRDQLEAKKQQYQQDEGDLQGQSSSLDTQIQQLTEQEREAARQGQQVTPVPAAAAGSTSASGFIRPVPGTMNSTFGWRYHPIYHYMKLHAGDDFPVACGTPVQAAQSGTVLDTTFNSQAGNKVILSHGVRDGKVITTSYHHLQGFAVSPGQHVEQGQTVGYVGTTGSSTGCHLHFEVHEDGTPVDPALWV